jgi:HSP20 family molecular chaperone IbpA
MMMVPSIFNDRLFDDWFDDDFFWPDFSRDEKKMNKKLYGHRAAEVMKTDVKEHENNYEVLVDLPGFKKEDVTCELKDGYLTITAKKNVDQDQKNKEGKYIRKERYSGTQSRSYFVGEHITEKDIHASFENGILKLEVPKMDQKQIEDRHVIEIV